MKKANKNNKAKYICFLCIQPYDEPPPPANRAGVPVPLKPSKSVPPRKILLYFFIVAAGRCHSKRNTPNPVFFTEPPFSKAITCHHPTKCLQWCQDRCSYYRLLPKNLFVQFDVQSVVFNLFNIIMSVQKMFLFNFFSCHNSEVLILIGYLKFKTKIITTFNFTRGKTVM